MSTKTTIKRIALVAVSALGMGLLSVVPASAAMSGAGAKTNVVTITAPGSDNSTASASTVNVGINVPITITIKNTFAGVTAGDSVTVLPALTKPAGSAVTVASSTCAAATSTGITSQTFTNCSDAIVITGTSGVANSTLTFTPDLVGDYVFAVATSAGNVTTAGQITVTASNSSSTVGSIYVSKYSIASGYSGTFLGTSAAVSADATAVTLVSGTFAAGTHEGYGIYSKANDAAGPTLDYIGSIASVNSATSLTLTAGARSALVAADTGAAAALAIGVPASTYTAYKVINANGINAMSVPAGASSALLVKLSAASANSTTAKVRAVINGAGQVGISDALAVAAGAQTTALVPFTAPTQAGTYAMTVQYSNDASFDGTVSKQLDIAFTLTVTALAGYSNSLSTAYSNTAANAAVGTADTDVVPVSGPATAAVATPNLPVGMVSIALKNTSGGSTGGALTNTLNASVSGPGYIVWAATGTNAWSATGCSGTKARSADLTATSAANSFFICGDGTSGVGTITIRVTDAAGAVSTLSTKKVTFYGAVAKLAATQIYSVAKAGGGTVGVNTAARTASTVIPAVIIFASDANGNGVGGLTIGLSSSDVTVANSNSTSACNADTPDDAAGTNAYSSGGIGYYNCQIVTPTSATSGKTATLTWRVLDPAGDGTTYLTATTPVSVGGAIKTSTLTMDKTSYAPGEAVVYTVTTKDSSGNTPYDGQAAFGAQATSNKAMNGTYPSTTKLIVNGKYTPSTTALYAPSTAGDFELKALDGTGLAYMSASATVADENATAAVDAANEATDAANAATDAANAAAEAADAATAAAQDAQAAVAELATKVASLMAGIKAQITSLTNLVIKIQKKVKA